MARRRSAVEALLVEADCDHLVFCGANRFGGYLPPILGCRSRPAGPVPQEPFRAGQTVVIQPNVVTRDGKAGVQVGEMVLITETGIERVHAFPRGFLRL